ncbi:MAG: hypothetical protein PHO27_11995 [Sulfuricurvum sp.]|jgi:hypothetical protein|nr:hypothetical protein [Sulfuricurvum sp.]
MKIKFGLMVDKFLSWLAWKLPEALVGYCFIRVIAMATTGKYSSTVVPELKATDALRRWLEK